MELSSGLEIEKPLASKSISISEGLCWVPGLVLKPGFEKELEILFFMYTKAIAPHPIPNVFFFFILYTCFSYIYMFVPHVFDLMKENQPPQVSCPVPSRHALASQANK